MSEYIVLRTDILIPNGPKISLNRTLTVEAYDKINFTIPSDTSDMSVDLQPGGSAGRVKLPPATSDWYGGTLSYNVDSAIGTSFEPDEPYLLIGRGATAILDLAPTQHQERMPVMLTSISWSAVTQL